MGIKEKLEAAGYDTSGMDENTLLSKLDAAGYDTSSLKGTTPTPQPMSKMDMVASAVKDASPTLQNLGEKGQQAFDKMGEAVAETFPQGVSLKNNPLLPAPLNVTPALTPGQGFRMNPTAAAVAGTAIQMTPDILMSLDAIPGSAPLRSAAKAMMKESTLFGPGKEAAIEASKRAVAPLEERLLAQRGAIAELPKRLSETERGLVEAKSAYGKAIGQAEEVGGYAIKHTPESFKDVIKDPKALDEMAKFMRKLGDTPVEDVVKSGDKMALNTARKFGQTFREIGDSLNNEITNEIRANVKMGAGKATEALEKMDKTFGSVMEQWRKADSKLRSLKSSGKVQKAAMAQAIRQTQKAIKDTKALMSEAVRAGAKRDAIRGILVKYGLGSLVGGTAAGIGWKLTQ